MKTTTLGILAVVLVIASGLVHGYWTERWSVSESVQNGASSVDRIPMKIGDWEGTPIKRKTQEQPGIARQVFRRYRNRRTGDEVSIAMICGRSGPVCIHTPEVCYNASGYRRAGNRTDVDVKFPGGQGKFYTADAVKTKATDQTALRIFWAWNVKGTWKVDPNPRTAFMGGRDVLYKMYVIRDLNARTELKMDPCADFLRQALPVLNETLATK